MLGQPKNIEHSLRPSAFLIAHVIYYINIFLGRRGLWAGNMQGRLTLLLAAPPTLSPSLTPSLFHLQLLAVSLNFTARIVAIFHLEAINFGCVCVVQSCPLSTVRCPLSVVSAEQLKSIFKSRQTVEKLLARLEAPTQCASCGLLLV